LGQIIIGLEPNRDTITLFEKKPPYDGFPNGDESDRSANEIEPVHSLFIELRPTKLLVAF
jgi:hypothetical protein